MLFFYKKQTISASISSYLRSSLHLHIRKVPLMPSPHYVPNAGALQSLVKKDGKRWIIKPRALEIMWGGDERYWSVPTGDRTDVELYQVSWLEVTGSLDLPSLGKGDYKVTFKLKLKPDAFGWSDSPVYFMAKPGKTAQYIWRKSDLSRLSPGKPYDVPLNPALNFTVPANPAPGDKLQFGMYEIWNGRWKGGLLIHEVVIERMN